eukprot:GHVT01066462.1.p1 GENE.GHVT01066462.1~~GHVT01066462.1.p1  ORF type:complete len:222 (+),score=33.73 GHVT01066462.1:203-868(+)
MKAMQANLDRSLRPTRAVKSPSIPRAPAAQVTSPAAAKMHLPRPRASLEFPTQMSPGKKPHTLPTASQTPGPTPTRRRRRRRTAVATWLLVCTAIAQGHGTHRGHLRLGAYHVDAVALRHTRGALVDGGHLGGVRDGVSRRVPVRWWKLTARATSRPGSLQTAAADDSLTIAPGPGGASAVRATKKFHERLLRTCSTLTVNHPYLGWTRGWSPVPSGVVKG